jgi:C1A family cysteine protease
MSISKSILSAQRRWLLCLLALPLFATQTYSQNAQPPAPLIKPKETATPAPQDKSIAYSIRPEYERLGVKVRDQGSQSSCVIFGIMGALDLYSARAGGSTQLSEQFARWADSKITGRLTLPQTGYSYATVIEGLKKFGICSAELMPYRSNSAGLPSKAALADASRRKTIIMTSLHEYTPKSVGFTDAEIDAICKSIANDQPVVCAAHWPKERTWAAAKFNTVENITNKDLDMGPAGLDGHIFVLVGYEKAANWEGGGRIQFRNSFGDKWGNSGYAWLSFGFLKKHGLIAFIVQGFF